MTTRTTLNDAWGPPVNLGPTVNTGDDWAPSISADGLELYFTSDRPGGFGVDLWVTKRATVKDNWGPPINLGAMINTSVFDGWPSVSADGLLLFLVSERPGGYGWFDLWVSRRRTTTDPWGPPVNLGPKINSASLEHGGMISGDGSMLYFDSMRPGGAGGVDLWQAPITTIVDFNRDGIVDAVDVGIMIEHWHTDYSLCDIGPLPWGDGIVDVQDLIVLSEYLFTDLRIFVDDDALDDPVPGDPLTGDPLEDGSTEHPFDSIQEAIDAVCETGCVVVLPWTYTGQGNRDITFRGKAITLRSLDPSDSQVVATTRIDCQGTQAAQHQGFVFKTGESSQSVLAGLIITNAYGYYGGGISCTANSSPTISKCVLIGNKAVKGGGGLCSQSGSPKVSNCLFSGNSAESGGGLYNSSNALVVNCTFINNSATSGSKIHNQGGALTLTNCILWNNTPPEIRVAAGTVSVTYSDIRGGFTGEGNIAVDPLFADPANGDYHLKSHWGRWDPVNESWVIDGITSPCIDTGDPSSPVGDEPEPNGGRINMGAHGGTPEASKSP
jgi:hypothetical protein